MGVHRYDTSMSKAFHECTRRYLVDGVASSFHMNSFDEYPIAMVRGNGSKLYDVDGNEYIDYVLGFGPMILGYRNQAVDESVHAQIALGTHFSAPTPSLSELAKRLTQIIPCAERVTLHNSGTEAVMQALRVARAYTGKMKIVKFEGQYHGWSDEEKITVDAVSVDELGGRESPRKILHTKGQRLSSADDLILLPWNDASALNGTLSSRNDVAAVIMEPVMCDSGPIPPQPGYLDAVREITAKHHVVLIFDEVITGFRLALGGAQEYYGVIPDLATFGKSIANGYPMAAVCGRKEIMECGVPASGTFNGNPVSVAAALATISQLSNPDVYRRMDQLGDKLCTGLLALGKRYGLCVYARHFCGLVMFFFGFDNDPLDFRDWLRRADANTYRLFVSGCEQYGIRFTDRRGREYLSTAHTEDDILRTLEVADVVLQMMRETN